MRSLALFSFGLVVIACTAEAVVAPPPDAGSPDAGAAPPADAGRPDVATGDAASSVEAGADAAPDADAAVPLPPGLDPTFGKGGIVWPRASMPGEDDARAIMIGPDGKILVVGSTTYPTLRVLMMQFEANGDLDQGFGTNGTVTEPYAAAAEALAVARQSDGKLVIAGSGFGGPSGLDFILMRFDDEGSIDPSFGAEGTGKIATSFGPSVDRANAVVVQPDGKIVAAGEAHSEATGKDFALARYLANGALDDTFNGSGKVHMALPNRESIHALATQVVDGEVRLLAAGTDGAAVALRFRADGSLDESFGTPASRTMSSEAGLARCRRSRSRPTGPSSWPGTPAARWPRHGSTQPAN